MDWFSILKYYKLNSDGTYSWFNQKDYDSKRRVDEQNKNRDAFLRIISNNAELDLPEIEQRKKSFEKQHKDLAISIRDMNRTFRDKRRELIANNTEKNKIKEFVEQYKNQARPFKDELSRLENEKKIAEQDLESYRRYNQSGKEFIDMAYEYGWNLPDELDSFLRTLDVVHGVTPEAIEGIIGLMPSETEEQDERRWKDGLRRTDIPMQDENTIMSILTQLISRGIAPKDITKYTIHDELGIDFRDMGKKWNKKDDEQLDKLIEMRAKSYIPMSEAERKWRGL